MRSFSLLLQTIMSDSLEDELKDGAVEGFRPAAVQAVYKVNAFNSVHP